jgi:phosphatidylinositol-bisphosphatase
VAISAKVNLATARMLNSGKDSLEDVLLLRVEGVRDFHVSVTADYLRSCLGMSLMQLLVSPQPVRETMVFGRLPGADGDVPAAAAAAHVPAVHVPAAVTAAAAATPFLAGGFAAPSSSSSPFSSSGGASSSAITVMHVPKELWRLIDLFSSNLDAMRQENLFMISGVESEMLAIQESLDTGSLFPAQCSVNSVADMICVFLKAPVESLIPPRCFPTADVHPDNHRPFCKKFLSLLPAASYTTFLYVLVFFRQILAERAYNGSTPEHLALVLFR